MISQLEKIQYGIESQKNKNLPADDEFETLENAYEHVQVAMEELQTVLDDRG